jgi:hypothetical protein
MMLTHDLRSDLMRAHRRNDPANINTAQIIKDAREDFKNPAHQSGNPFREINQYGPAYPD